MGRAGHAFYRYAHFFSLAETTELLTSGGFEVLASRATFVGPPGADPECDYAHEGLDSSASFVALSAVVN